jgi:hypothetical protein
MSLAAYREGFAETEQLEAEAQNLMPGGPTVVRRKVFAFGPDPGPWANGRMAALYGLILSLPFEIAALIRLGRGYNSFPLLDGVRELLFPLSTWVLSAFVFGYFYHQIRGRDGFEKALVFSAALIIPTIPIRMIGGAQVLSAGHLWEIFEIIAFMLLLALLAFDLRLLSRLKYTWRELVGAYGLNSIVAYTGSLAVAAIGIAVQQQLVSFLTDLFKKK